MRKYNTKDKKTIAVILGEVENSAGAIDSGYKSEYVGYLDYKDGSPITWNWYNDGTCAFDADLNSPEKDIDFNSPVEG